MVNSMIDTAKKAYISSLLHKNASHPNFVLKCILFGSRQKLGTIDYNIKLSLGNSSLNYCNKYKYLGVTFDNEMNLSS